MTLIDVDRIRRDAEAQELIDAFGTTESEGENIDPRLQSVLKWMAYSCFAFGVLCVLSLIVMVPLALIGVL